MNTTDSKKGLLVFIASIIVVLLLWICTAVLGIMSAPPVVYTNEDLQRELRDLADTLSVSLLDIDTDIASLLTAQNDMLKTYASSYDQLTVLNLAILEWAEDQGLIIREAE